MIIVKIEDDEIIPSWFNGLRVTEQEGSDLLPVIFKIKYGEEAEERKTANTARSRLRWKESKVESLLIEWQNYWESDEKREKEQQKDLEDRWQEMTKKIYEAAKAAGMI